MTLSEFILYPLTHRMVSEAWLTNVSYLLNQRDALIDKFNADQERASTKTARKGTRRSKP